MSFASPNRALNTLTCSPRANGKRGTYVRSQLLNVWCNRPLSKHIATSVPASKLDGLCYSVCSVGKSNQVWQARCAAIYTTNISQQERSTVLNLLSSHNVAMVPKPGGYMYSAVWCRAYQLGRVHLLCLLDEPLPSRVCDLKVGSNVNGALHDVDCFECCYVVVWGSSVCA